MKDASALNIIWASLVTKQRLRLEELARETGLPQQAVAEVIGFLIRYDFVSITPSSSSVKVNKGAMSLHVAAMILETFFSQNPFLKLNFSWN